MSDSSTYTEPLVSNDGSAIYGGLYKRIRIASNSLLLHLHYYSNIATGTHSKYMLVLCLWWSLPHWIVQYVLMYGFSYTSVMCISIYAMPYYAH